MRTTVQVDIEPFRAPNCVFVNIKDAATHVEKNTLPAIPLSELDSATLSALCEAFRIEVFRKANKELPPESAR